ncbi:sigma 54-interacting transcriptional regulator [Clostridium sp. YIM B02515]|uniref:Sigma 54-interacting transcriptional regulator n=1 Tax=Clostridium rhizosphaerae TaxID=2803861 RepID=A0ABS1T709_9CLOT|nr:sigma 54-interacting transcriptional regulator [Clostridium rhizosphaerae]MBL4935130.1 sigma 54-interacting transcriptional regulator [Clostridium rhizosphaerae]
MSKVENILLSLLENLDVGVQIVDNRGRTIYYNDAMSKVEGLRSEEVIGKKVVEYLKGVEEESSTLMNALKNKEKYVDVIQHYSSHYGKEVTTINTTIPVLYNSDIVAAIEISKDMTQLKELSEKICRLEKKNINSKNSYTFKDIIGKSLALKDSVNKAMRASLSNSSVLVYGETGCGKELFAQSIHYNGIRKDMPFVAVNCAAIPSSLLEAMLFGTVTGSFTGAENKRGLFEEANGGTILLDEINSMDTTLQSKLLRVLQECYIRPLGSNKTIDTNVRIIATLNEEPEKLIKEGKLRKDFYYRISVIRIDVPPLRKRKEDIDVLVKHFINHYNKMLGKYVSDIDEEVRSMFMNYEWPGNIRELKNTIEYAMNMIDNNLYISKEYVENRIFKIESAALEVTNDAFDLRGLSLEEYKDNIEKKIILNALKRYNCNISKAAAYLKISRQNLQYKIKKYELL